MHYFHIIFKKNFSKKRTGPSLVPISMNNDVKLGVPTPHVFGAKTHQPYVLRPSTPRAHIIPNLWIYNYI